MPEQCPARYVSDEEGSLRVDSARIVQLGFPHPRTFQIRPYCIDKSAALDVGPIGISVVPHPVDWYLWAIFVDRQQHVLEFLARPHWQFTGMLVEKQHANFRPAFH